MKCDLFREAVWTAADGGLDPELQARLDAHLAECSACRAASEQARRISAALGDLRVGGPFEAPSELRERTLAALAATAARPAAPIVPLSTSRWRRFAAPLALLAATLVVVVGWFQTRLGAPAPEQLARRDDAPAAAPAAAPVAGAPAAVSFKRRDAGEAGPAGTTGGGGGGVVPGADRPVDAVDALLDAKEQGDRDDATAAVGTEGAETSGTSETAEERHDLERSMAGDEKLKSDGESDGESEGESGGFDKEVGGSGDAAAPLATPGAPATRGLAEGAPAPQETIASDDGPRLEGGAQWAGALPIEPARLLAAATPAEALTQLRSALPREEVAKPKGRPSEPLGRGARGRGQRGGLQDGPRGGGGSTEKSGEPLAPPPGKAGDDGTRAGLDEPSAPPTRLLFARLDGAAAEVAERVAGLERAGTTTASVGFLGGFAPNEAARDGELLILDLDEAEWLALDGVEALAPEAWFALQRDALAAAAYRAAKAAHEERAPIGGAKRATDRSAAVEDAAADRAGLSEDELAKSRAKALAEEPKAPGKSEERSKAEPTTAPTAASGATPSTSGGERRRVRVVLFLAPDAAADEAPARAGRD